MRRGRSISTGAKEPRATHPECITDTRRSLALGELNRLNRTERGTLQRGQTQCMEPNPRQKNQSTHSGGGEAQALIQANPRIPRPRTRRSRRELPYLV